MRQWDTKCVNALCWHKGSIKGGVTGWAERYIGKYELEVSMKGKELWNVKIAFDVNEKWHKLEPEKVVESDSWKIL